MQQTQPRHRGGGAWPVREAARRRRRAPCVSPRAMQEDEANTRPRDWTQRYAFTPLPSFGPQQWVAHREPGRYLRHALAFPASRLAHNLALPVAYSVAAVALLAAYDAEAARLGWPRMAHSDGLGPLGLSSSALSLLLVFRTNASYKRYDESRHTWGVVVNTSRNLVRQAHLFFPPDAASEKAALRRWVVALAHCTRLHMRAPLEQAPAELAAARPPLQPAEADAVAASMHRPNFCLQALGKLISLNVADRYVAMKLDECLTRLEDAVGSFERLYRTPIPLIYTRHNSRLLLVWLLYLPVALWAEYSSAALFVSPLLVIALFGIEEIGIELEEPGGILPMFAFCQAIEEQTAELVAIDAQVTALALAAASQPRCPAAS